MNLNYNPWKIKFSSSSSLSHPVPFSSSLSLTHFFRGGWGGGGGYGYWATDPIKFLKRRKYFKKVEFSSLIIRITFEVFI